MSETLAQKQQRFTRLLAGLILYMCERGYAPVLGECKRSDEQAEINALGVSGRFQVARLVEKVYPKLAEYILNNGKANGVRMSTHILKLAADIDLFKDGSYLSSTADHREFGEWWEKQGLDCCWGGRFNDGNHYSLSHNGVK